MAPRTDDLQQEIADTQQDIDTTRSAMTEKLEMLGEQVRETVEGAQASVEKMVENVRDTVDTTVATVKQTVEGAQASVEGIVENVKETVGETVEAVQRTFDLHHQMEQHPWLLFGGATMVGYLLGSGGSGSRTSAAGSTTDTRVSPASPIPAPPSESPTSSKPQQGTGSGDLGWFTDEIAAIKSAAVGAVMSTVWGMVKQALPSSPPRTSAMSQQHGRPSERPAQTPAALSSTTINGSAIL
jgi:ElaB/YqjD/DUF883 family membrane-anchored ribosome-binding protein